MLIPPSLYNYTNSVHGMVPVRQLFDYLFASYVFHHHPAVNISAHIFSHLAKKQYLLMCSYNEANVCYVPHLATFYIPDKYMWTYSMFLK